MKRTYERYLAENEGEEYCMTEEEWENDLDCYLEDEWESRLLDEQEEARKAEEK